MRECLVKKEGAQAFKGLNVTLHGAGKTGLRAQSSSV